MRYLWFKHFCMLMTLCAVIAPLSAAAADNPALQAIHNRIQQGEIPNVHSVLVAQDGRTIAEWYFSGTDERRGAPLGTISFGPDTLHDIRSASKSIVSLLFGIAVSQGAIPNLEVPVLDYFPEYKDLQTADRRKIRLKDLLTMTSGLHWDEHTYSYIDPRNSETAMDLASDRMRHILSQPIEAPPGSRWTYSGGDVALIGEVIARATKKPLDVFARDSLFTPMGITAFEWLKDDKGVPYAASGLRLRPRDMLKIGQLMLDQGRFNGRQVVPASWIEAATAPAAHVDSDGKCPTEYGYFWWLWPTCTPGYYAAMGNGGQRIFLMPSRKLVIVITAGLYNDDKQGMMRLITRGVIDALSPPPAP
jgi:CubicO group peptidase (beta-lactamase class C family)